MGYVGGLVDDMRRHGRRLGRDRLLDEEHERQVRITHTQRKRAPSHWHVDPTRAVIVHKCLRNSARQAGRREHLDLRKDSRDVQGTRARNEIGITPA